MQNSFISTGIFKHCVEKLVVLRMAWFPADHIKVKIQI